MDEFNCSYDHLKFDEACVNMISDDKNLNKWLYSLSMDCLSCPYKRITQILNNVSLKFSTVKTIQWRVLNNSGNDEYVSAKITSNIICELSPNLGQYGLYELAVQNNTYCNFKTLKNPTYPYSGCLTAIFQVFLGVHAGIILIIYKDWKERVIRWILWAAFYGCLGSAFHFTNIIPVNKNLWSLSFVFVSTSFALAFFSGCYLLIDVTKVWQGGPFRISGMNALVLYVGHSMCYQIFPFHWRIGAMNSRALCLIESIWVVTFWAIIAYIMHRKRTYITL